MHDAFAASLILCSRSPNTARVPFMEVVSHLMELATVHPHLEWDNLVAAAVAILEQEQAQPPFRLELAVEHLPTFDDETLSLTILPEGVSPAPVARLRRTYEMSRLVEGGALAVAGRAR